MQRALEEDLACADHSCCKAAETVPVYCRGLVVLPSRRMQFAMLFVSLIRDVVLFSVKGPFGTGKKISGFKGSLIGQISF